MFSLKLAVRTCQKRNSSEPTPAFQDAHRPPTQTEDGNFFQETQRPFLGGQFPSVKAYCQLHLIPQVGGLVMKSLDTPRDKDNLVPLQDVDVPNLSTTCFWSLTWHCSWDIDHSKILCDTILPTWFSHVTRPVWPPPLIEVQLSSSDTMHFSSQLSGCFHVTFGFKHDIIAAKNQRHGLPSVHAGTPHSLAFVFNCS